MEQQEAGRQEPSELQEISNSRQRGFAFICQALDCEETGNGLDLAPILYKLGIRELSYGIGLCEERECDSKPRVQQLRREMLVSLSRAKDRLDYFEQKESNPETQTQENVQPMRRTPTGNNSVRHVAPNYEPRPSTPSSRATKVGSPQN